MNTTYSVVAACSDSPTGYKTVIDGGLFKTQNEAIQRKFELLERDPFRDLKILKQSFDDWEVNDE